MVVLITQHVAKVFLAGCLLLPSIIFGQELSIARQWNEVLLNAIRRDYARPPVHARNLYHVSAAMYEAWAAYDPSAEPFLLGRTRSGFTCSFDGCAVPADVEAARMEAMSFAVYRILIHRFQNSPGVFLSTLEFNEMMDLNGFDRSNTSVDYVAGGPAELGNYIASQIIAYGFQDGSMEQLNFANQYYSPVNVPLVMAQPGNPTMTDPNRWQQLTLALTVDQQGNPIPSTPPFQSPEWGNVDPFAMTADQMTEQVRDGDIYKVYNDPGAPPLLDTTSVEGLSSFYKWIFCMVPIWQSHLTPDDGVMIDISPASKGNIQDYPETEQEIRDFYDYLNGGDPGTGYQLNPITGEPYTPQFVKRGDYTRILAEFWADGPTSETPPGHWFSIMHHVMDHPLFERRWMGEGEILGELEYDVKAHFVLAGSLHDAAITAWGIKGWYDYVRPVSAIRYMAQHGQCTDTLAPNFHPAGMPLVPGYIEQIAAGDPIAGDQNEHVGKVKLYTWLGHDMIVDPTTDVAGVGWMLAERWFPYQRPTFVTPPFAGYISGHSTYSRTAAEVLTLITGSPFFPGGISDFVAPQNDFLHFEQGPSEEIVLQWATYRDASDQCSLSRIWGGIHPPIDDIPGRKIGTILGPNAVAQGNEMFNSERPIVSTVVASDAVLNINDIGDQFQVDIVFDQAMDTSVEPLITMIIQDPLQAALIGLGAGWTSPDTYTLSYQLLDTTITLRDIHMRIDSAYSAIGKWQNVHLASRPFSIDTERPLITATSISSSLINEALVSVNDLELLIEFDEPCSMLQMPDVAIPAAPASLIYDAAASYWMDDSSFIAKFQLIDNDDEIADLPMTISNVFDPSGNAMLAGTISNVLAIDTRSPSIVSIEVSDPILSLTDVGSEALIVDVLFDEVMDMSQLPQLNITGNAPVNGLILDEGFWLDQSHFQISYSLLDLQEQFNDLSLAITGAKDLAANEADDDPIPSLFSIDTERSAILTVEPSIGMIANAQIGFATFSIAFHYTEPMDPTVIPQIVLAASDDISGSLIHETALDQWSDGNIFTVNYTVIDEELEVSDISASTAGAQDLAGNEQVSSNNVDLFSIDTRDPQVIVFTASTYEVTEAAIGDEGFQLISIFSEAMEQTTAPSIILGPQADQVLFLNANTSGWLNNTTYRSVYDVQNVVMQLDIPVELSGAVDLAGNTIPVMNYPDFLSISITDVGIETITLDGFDIYPNPVTPGGWIHVQLNVPFTSGTASILDNNGRLVWKERMIMIGGRTSIRIPRLPQGTYTLVMEDADRRLHNRIVLLER
ncbi:MAG: T9SS type A sorting domain-containing protein [Bacteroidota bacterium]|nr:T9SS type A sorting domain-containing protein [Bacteroidota bacterium]